MKPTTLSLLFRNHFRAASLLLSFLLAVSVVFAQQPAPKIEVTSATYGAGSKVVDVAPAISAVLAKGRYDITVGNGLASADPAEGTVKELRVVYTIDGVSRTITAGEGDQVNLRTGKTSRLSAASEEQLRATLSADVLAAVKPRLIPVRYACDDYVVASVVVTDPAFGAKADATTDCTEAVQRAIDAAFASGGGVVFFPAGRYAFDGTLLLRPNVTLRGDWKQPGDTPQSQRVEGAVLMPRGGRGSEDGTPFISLQAGACVRNLSIYYPDQKASGVVAYPWTIGTDVRSGMDCFTVQNVTLVNSYQGLRLGPDDCELSEVRNVYGTPLKTGFSKYYASDTPRIVHLRYSPDYWLNAGLGAAPHEAALRKYLFDNGTGLVFMRTDGHDLFDVKVSGYGVGILFQKGPAGTPYGGMYDVSATGGNIGVLAIEGRTVWQFTRCRFEGRTAGLWAKEKYNTHLQFDTCQLAGADALRDDGSASVQMESCACTGNVNMTGPGALTMVACRLIGSADRVKLGPDVVRSLIQGGIAASRVENHSLGCVRIDPAPVEAREASQCPPLPPDPRPAKALLFNVESFGAKSDGLTDAPFDNTGAFQRALDAAGRAGGGTVFVPGGLYRFAGSLFVPSGVELRGCSDGSHHTQTKGSVLLPTAGRGDENGKPFISLATGSGARGVTIYYPDQKIDQVKPYPWTFRSLGPRCWVLDVAAANPYQMIDFGSNPSEGHLIRYVMSDCLRRGFWVSKGNGTIDGCTMNPHLWQRQFKGAPKLCAAADVPASVSSPMFGEYLFDHQEAIIVGSSPRELQVNVAICPGGTGLTYESDGGVSGGGWAINHESDSHTLPLLIKSVAPAGLEMSNTILATVVKSRLALQVEKSNSGRVSLFNGSTWGDSIEASFSLLGSGTTEIHNWSLGQDRVLAGYGDIVMHSVECRTSAAENVEAVAPLKRLALCANSSGADPFTYPAASTVFARGNGADIVSVPLNDRFATGFEPGQPAPSCRLVVNQDLLASECKLVPGAGRNGSAGLVLTASPKLDSKHTAGVFELFTPQGLVVKPDTLLRFWLHPGNPMGRNTVVDLNFSDGRVLRGAIDDIGGRSMHPMAKRGAVGKWTKVECRIGRYAPGMTIKSIVFIFDTGHPTGDANAVLDDIEIGEPEPSVAPGGTIGH
ncbi:MAG: glycosyl hydrolase family 28-related protein [Capsulimonadaceae bacterium]|nr:glycosyl hydrolase family 28-related protein [Capsulimonadaceae bacterium]